MANLISAARVRLWHGLLAALLLILALVVYTIVNLDSMRTAQAAQARVVTALSSNLAGAQAQLKQHGIQPSQPPPQQIISEAGPPGAAGATGPAGRDGSSGPSGAPGVSGAPGAAGSPGAVGPSGPVGPTGPSGTTGALGNQGPSGAAGPSGPSGAVGPTGPGGAQGSAGEPGSPGPTGPSGPSGAAGQDPSGWVYRDALGVAHTCSPDSTTPAPHYTCT